jgi:DNA repair protein RadC
MVYNAYEFKMVKVNELKAKANEPEIAAALAMEALKGELREKAVVMTLNTKLRITGVFTVSIGTLDTSLIHSRDVFRGAISQNAAAVILAHNRPSGDPHPSESDKAVTNKLMQAGEILGIKFLDHLIIGDETFYSIVAQKEMPLPCDV